jgi:hypothetical protein
MIDAEYFRAQLPQQIEAASERPIVEVFLRNGHAHRVRAVVDATPGYVVLEAFHLSGSHASQTSHWQEELAASPEESPTFRVTIAYESIVQVIVDAAPPSAERRPGSFGFSTRPGS